MRSYSTTNGTEEQNLAADLKSELANETTPSAREPSDALKVGLEILEYISKGPKLTTRSSIAAALNIPNSTVYRSMMVLERKGYISRTGPQEAYETTGKLWLLQSTAPAHQRLLNRARSVMKALSEDVAQSCNLAIPALPHMQVVSQQESSGPYGISVPVGFKYQIPNSAPGIAFAAFTKSFDPARCQTVDGGVIQAQQWSALKKAAQKAYEVGFAQAENPYLPDVVDLACPIFDGGQFVAALTVPYIKSVGGMSQVWCLAALQEAVERLNNTLMTDTRVA